MEFGCLKKTKDIVTYREMMNNNAFFKTRTTLADMVESKVFRFNVYNYKKGFYLIGVNKAELKAWIREGDVALTFKVYTDLNDNNKLVSVSMRNLKRLGEEDLDYSLNPHNLIITSDIASLLETRKNQYFATNCGIHSLLASLVMMQPEKFGDMVKNPDMIAQLEKISINNNQARLAKILKLMGGVGGAVIVGYGLQDPSQAPVSAGVFATGLAFCALNPGLALQKLFRSKVGIMPEKLVEVGNAGLKMLDLDKKRQLILKKENNLDNLITDWKRIIVGGSPIIAMLRSVSALTRVSALSGHYVVIYGISKDNNVYYWDLGAWIGFNFIPEEELEMSIDSFKNPSFRASSWVGGIGSRFNYLHFTSVES